MYLTKRILTPNKKIEMKSQKFIKSFSQIALVAIVGLIVFATCGLIAGAFGIGIGGVVMAEGTIVSGGTITQEAAVDADVLDMSDVQRNVELYKPYQTPLLTLISDNHAPAVESWKYDFYAIDSRGLSTTISDDATSISSNVVTLPVASSSMFKKRNTVSFTGMTGDYVSSGMYLTGIVSAVASSTSIEVTLLNMGTVAVADFNGQVIYRAGSAMNETAASTSVWGKLPEKDYNYIQNFMEQIEESEFQKLMKKEADWGMKDLKKMAVEDFKMQRERTFLNGFRGFTTVNIDGEDENIYTCGGLLNDTDIPQIPQTLTDLDNAAFISWMKAIFTGNNGAKNRFGLLGADLAEAVEAVNVDNKWITAKETSMVGGLEFTKIVSIFGTLNLSYYEQLDLLGMEKDGLIIDKNNLWTGDLKGAGFNIRKIDKKSSGIAKVDSAVIEQSSTILIKNKATHHRIIGA